jgi:hypothetical protein
LTIDGAVDPIFDLPLPEVFGVTAPFTPPLAVDRTVASGGNISVVPIAFRDGCRLSLIGAENARIWFQVTGHRLASDHGVASFTGDEDLTLWRTLLDTPGSDPWIDGDTHRWYAGEAELAQGQTRVLAELAGPDSLTGLRLDVSRAAWDAIELVLDFDGQRTAMALADFFAVGRASDSPTRSLLVGVDDRERLYSWFPMPFFRSATVAVRLAGSAPGPVALGFGVRHRDQPPEADSGLFGARLEVIETSVAGRDSVIVDLDGPGRWVGLFLEAGSIGSGSRSFLEGDERIHVDGSSHPMLYGTGVEDFFGGGFYFRIDEPVSVPFRRALHGMTYELGDPVGRAMGMYRFMPTDGPVFGTRLRVGLESGPENLTPIRLRAVSYSYRRVAQRLRMRDRLDVGDDSSRIDHHYGSTGDQSCAVLDALFEDEPPTELEARRCTTEGGVTSFVLRGAGRGRQLLLRRRFDDGDGDQRAVVSLAGGTSHGLRFEDANPFRRWRERDLPLGPWEAVDGEVAVSIAVPLATGFSEAAWELWAGYPPGICDLVLDGVCDAADVAEAVRKRDVGAPPEQLDVTLSATFD